MTLELFFLGCAVLCLGAPLGVGLVLAIGLEPIHEQPDSFGKVNRP
jgi:hypothetical protein